MVQYDQQTSKKHLASYSYFHQYEQGRIKPGCTATEGVNTTVPFILPQLLVWDHTEPAAGSIIKS